MGRLTEKQTAIVQFIREKEVAKKSDIVKQFDHWYYVPGDKYIGEMLHRLMEKGVIMREKVGYYKLGKEAKQTKEEANNYKLDFEE